MRSCFDDLIGNIGNKDIANFTQAVLNEVPAEFFTMPASTSGKYHPPEARERGGLVWHTRRACWFANMFFEALKIKADNIQGDIVLSALILHDIGKKADYKNDFLSYKKHAEIAVKMIQKHKHLIKPVRRIDENGKQKDIPAEKIFKNIESCILYHMGPFSYGVAQKDMTDYNLLELIAYFSDYLSANKEIII